MKSPNFKNRMDVIVDEFTDYKGTIKTSPMFWNVIEKEFQNSKKEVLKVKIGKKDLILIRKKDNEMEFDFYEYDPPF